MGLLFSSESPLDLRRQQEEALLHRTGCALCPLRDEEGCDMQPTGSDHPLIYALGEAPGREEAEQQKQFVGRSGQLLRDCIPDRRILPLIRWNNCVRSRPPNNREPRWDEIESCRPSIVRDIEQSKPKAIFGFGNIALEWVTRLSGGISVWTGRRMPVRIGQHTCWFFPLYHPAYICHLDNEETEHLHEIIKFTFELHVRRAFAAVDKLPAPVVHSPAMAKEAIEFPNTLKDVLAALDALRDEEAIGIDLETVGLRPYEKNAAILTIALSGAHKTYAFGIQHPGTAWSKEDLQKIGDALLNFLRVSKGRKVSFTPFELEWLACFFGSDLVFGCHWEDAQAQAFILDERKGALSLNALCIQYFGLELKSLSNVNVENLKNEPLDKVLRYNALDAKYHRLLYFPQEIRIKQEGLQAVYEHHVSRIQSAVLQQMQGVPINQKTAKRFAGQYEKTLAGLEEEMKKFPEIAVFAEKRGYNYRPSAPRDTSALFADIGHPLKSTKEDEIEKINHPLAKLHLDWKHAAKVLSTYIKPVLDDAMESTVFPDSLLHPVLSLVKTRTWRSSMEEPNCQNWPKHYDGAEVREQIEAPDGYYIVSLDYGQIQARNVAMESKDKILVKSFWDRHDIHSDWRDRIFELWPKWPKEGLKQVLTDKKLMKFYRGRAKNQFVFASFFGAGGKKVAGTLGIPENIGFKLAEEFDDAFPEVYGWQQGLHRFYDKYGYVTGLSGFRRRAPVAHTEIINTPIQSDEAIIVFDAHVRCARAGFVPMLMVHDDLVFLWRAKDIDRNAEQVVKIMLDCPFEWTRIVPIAVEMSIGRNWARMEEAGTFESDRAAGRKEIEAALDKALGEI